MTARLPHRTRRSQRAQNIVDNLPASDWRTATAKDKRALGIVSKEPFYVPKHAKIIRKGSAYISRDELTVKKFGLHRRKLAETRATQEGATHPIHGYKRPLTGKMQTLLRERRRLKLVREARRVFERHGRQIASKVGAAARVQFPEGLGKSGPRGTRGRMLRGDVKSEFRDLLDQAIGPDTGRPVESREIEATRSGAKGTNLSDGVWHQLIDAVRDAEGDSSPLVKLLRSSGRYYEGGVWVTD
jgi:hypothetical protein